MQLGGGMVWAVYAVCRSGITILCCQGVAPGQSGFKCALEVEDKTRQACKHLTD